MANGSSIGVEAVVTGNRGAVAKSANQKSNPRASKNGNGAQSQDAQAEQDVWLAILGDWKNKARSAGINVEVYDARPHENAFVIVVTNVCYHADCDTFSRGNVCGKCGCDVATDEHVKVKVLAQ